MTMLPDLIWWLTIDLALVAGVALAAQRASCARHVRRMWGSSDNAGSVDGLIVLCVPCKGDDLELADNLRGLFQQQRVQYELRFIVEDAADPAVPVIERLRREHCNIPSRLFIAGRAEESGQKIHNLRVATEHLPDDCTVLAFADSDVCPDRLWLHALTHVLTRPGIGASTGYRWFVPQRLSLPNLLVFSMNAGAAACLGRRVFNLIWGGSWAISRSHFEQLGLREVWRGTLNDDLVATRVVRGAGLKIDFEPRCLCPSPLDVTWPQALNFIHRQLLQARYYATGHFWWGAAAVLIQAAACLLAVGTLVGSALVGQLNDWALFACVCLFAVSVFRAFVGHATWRPHFLAQENKIRSMRRMEYLVGPLLTVLAGLCVVRTCFSNTMVWRGLRYRLHGGGQIMFLGRQLDDKSCPVTCSQSDEPRILKLRKKKNVA